MHDVAKGTVAGRKHSLRRWIRPVIYTAIAVFAIIGLIKLPLIIKIPIIGTLLIWFGFMAIRRFRAGHTTSGALFAVLAALSLLMDLKLLQFRAMAAAGAKMTP